MMRFVQVLTAASFLLSVAAASGHGNNSYDTHRQLRGGADDTVRVVAYNSIKGYLNWIHPWFIEYGRKNCSRPCELILNPSKVASADVVLFLASTMDKSTPKFPKNKKQDTMYALMSMEQPKYAPVLQKTVFLKEKFDLMMTYSLSDRYGSTGVPNLPMTYYPLNIVAMEAIMQPARPFQDKDGVNRKGDALVSVFASNCKNAGASDRSKFLEDFMELVPTHSFGKCLHNMDEPMMKADPNWPEVAQRRARKVKVLSRYKFYLAFENAPVSDYVSEKVFEGLIAGSIPIYRGTDSISKFLPVGSYINANGMKPAELANLVLKLAGDEKAYNEYFDFKQKPIAPHFVEMASMSYTHPKALCRLCDYYTNSYRQH